MVDDSPTIRLTVSAALRAAYEGMSVQITEAASEKEAVDRFMGGTFDAVFLDMMLGGSKTAMDVVRAILAAKPDAKVILTTGLDRENKDVVEAISMGAFGYLRKPVRAADVRTVLDELASESGRVSRIK